jgi:hypothetical protein
LVVSLDELTKRIDEYLGPDDRSKTLRADRHIVSVGTTDPSKQTATQLRVTMTLGDIACSFGPIACDPADLVLRFMYGNWYVSQPRKVGAKPASALLQVGFVFDLTPLEVEIYSEGRNKRSAGEGAFLEGDAAVGCLVSALNDPERTVTVAGAYAVPANPNQDSPVKWGTSLSRLAGMKLPEKERAKKQYCDIVAKALRNMERTANLTAVYVD